MGMSDPDHKVQELLAKMTKVSEEYRKKGKDPKSFLKKIDKLVREYYKLKHPELQGGKR